jgi:hypothetical protein
MALYLAMVQVDLAKEAEHFFAVYKDMEGKFTKELGWKNRDAVQEIIRATRICLATTRAQINHRLSNSLFSSCKNRVDKIEAHCSSQLSYGLSVV